MSEPLKIGLTGGIASGKSTVADLFRELGAEIIDTDLIAREVVMPGQPGLEAVADEFGDAILDPSGALDRAALRQLVFSDDEARRRLEDILHPRIQQQVIRQSEKLARGGPSDHPRAGYQVIVVPLLVDSALRSFVHRIAVVDCDEQTQLERLLARDAETEAQARRMLAAQSGREARLAIADDVIDNSGTVSETRRQVVALHEKYVSLT